jgi:creatinine amidohydrolase
MEVEEYLKRSDVIFIPVGTIETHGTFPLDIETTVPEGIALEMAEKTDGLVLGGLPYFFCGATTIARGTVQMSVKDGVQYLEKIAHSLLNQGFRRQIYLSLHGPAFLTAGTVVIDFFDETKVPITYLALEMAAQVASAKGVFVDMNALCYGAYKKLNKLDELVVDPNAEENSRVVDLGHMPSGVEMEKMISSMASSSVAAKYQYFFGKYAHPSGAVGFYFDEPSTHGGSLGALRSIEERDRRGEEGLKAVADFVDALDMPEYVRKMRELDEWTQSFIMPKYGKYLPRNKFPDPNC